MATIVELVEALRIQIGDTDSENYNISEEELKAILKSAANEYSRIKGYIKIYETLEYNKDVQIYDIPEDNYKVKSVQLKSSKRFLQFIDNTDQIYLTELPDVEPDVLKITYTRYFQPDEVIERELDLYLLYAEALCYKLMAAKTAELIKFATGEKVVDESLLSEKYLKLYNDTAKSFRNRAIKSYGRKADHLKENLNYRLPYPTEGEVP